MGAGGGPGAGVTALIPLLPGPRPLPGPSAPRGAPVGCGWVSAELTPLFLWVKCSHVFCFVNSLTVSCNWLVCRKEVECILKRDLKVGLRK